MKVLDLFSGLGGWSQAFKDRGHDVIMVDIEPKFKPDIVADIMTLEAKDFERFGKFDLILASPPCDCFSVASVYRHWKEGKPTDDKTISRIALAKHTFKLIDDLKPSFWVIENPMGMMRKVVGMPTFQISQCQYGRKVMKPTDLWAYLPGFVAKKCKPGADCHERASHSSKTGTQGIVIPYRNSELTINCNASERAKIPYGLSLAVCEACEEALK